MKARLGEYVHKMHIIHLEDSHFASENAKCSSNLAKCSSRALQDAENHYLRITQGK